MIRIHTDGKCPACVMAVKALKMSDINFEEKGLNGVEIKGGLPILVNTDNGLTYHGWVGSIDKLRKALKIKEG